MPNKSTKEVRYSAQCNACGKVADVWMSPRASYDAVSRALGKELRIHQQANLTHCGGRRMMSVEIPGK